VYVASPEAFAQVDAFVNESVAAYRLDLTRYALPKKDAFRLYLEEHNTVKAILMGITRSDPQGQTLTHFDETDQGWPAFMRVHPIIDWDHDEIWAVSLPVLLHKCHRG
jgi:FAD synthetase